MALRRFVQERYIGQTDISGVMNVLGDKAIVRERNAGRIQNAPFTLTTRLEFPYLDWAELILEMHFEGRKDDVCRASSATLRYFEWTNKRGLTTIRRTLLDNGFQRF